MYSCLFCGNKLSRKGRFCSNKCQLEYQHQQYIEDWKCGKVNGIRG